MIPTDEALRGRPKTRSTFDSEIRTDIHSSTHPETLSRYRFEVDGVEIGVFGEVTGVRADVGIDEICAAGEPLPGRTSRPHLVLRHGVTETDALFDWLSRSSGNALAGDEVPKLPTASVSALDARGTTLRTWEITGVFPIRWKRPDFQVGERRPPEEELELAHHGALPTAPALPTPH